MNFLQSVLSFSHLVRGEGSPGNCWCWMIGTDWRQLWPWQVMFWWQFLHQSTFFAPIRWLFVELFFRPLLAFPDHDGEARPLLSDCDRAASKMLSSTTPSTWNTRHSSCQWCQMMSNQRLFRELCNLCCHRKRRMAMTEIYIKMMVMLLDIMLMSVEMMVMLAEMMWCWLRCWEKLRL